MQIQVNNSSHRVVPGSDQRADMDPDRRIRVDAPKTVEAPRLTLDQMMMMEMI